MRDLLSKVMTGSMIVGAALVVASCGKGEDATNNMAYNTDDALMGTNDITAADAMNGTGDNLGAMDSNTTDTGTTNTTTTNGM